MSGGSYCYLYSKEPDELFHIQNRDFLREMTDRFRGLGYNDVADEVSRITAVIDGALDTLRKVKEPLEPVMKGVEWLDSSDRSEEDLLEDVEEWRATRRCTETEND